MFVMLTIACASAADNQTADNVALESDSVTDVILTDDNADTGDFSELNTTIATGGSELKLEKDYTYDSSKDSAFQNGIKIDKDNYVLDGDDHTISGANVAQIFLMGENSVTFKNINFINASGGTQGGAMESKGNVTFINCNFSNNYANFGGVIYVAKSRITVTMENCNFENNTAGRAGTAYLALCYVTIKNCNFTNNTAKSGWGGALAIYNSPSAIIENSMFKNNRANETGGAINSDASKPTVKNCDFINNTAGTSGGALYFDIRTKGTVENSNFTDNNATKLGGAIHFKLEGTVTGSRFENSYVNQEYGGAIYFASTGKVTGSYFKNSTAASYGGAVYFESEGRVESSNFTDNDAPFGGGVYFSTNGSIVNSNFDHNTKSSQGSGVYFNNTGSVENSVFTNNYASTGAAAVYFNRNGTVINSSFTNNHANAGGAIYINGYDKNNTIEGCNFTNNAADQVGGAIYTYSTLIVNNSNFNENTVKYDGYATGWGGAIYAYSALTVNNTNFTKNRSLKGNYGRSGDGGAVYVLGDFNAENSNFIDNSGYNGGAAYIGGYGIITNSNFTYNKAELSGGAIYADVRCDVDMSYFAFNEAYILGGAYYSKVATINNTAFVNNTLTGESNDVGGGAVYASANGYVENSNFTKNSAYKGGAIYYNDIGWTINSNFTYNRANTGGAIYSRQTDKVERSYFAFNSAADYGGALYAGKVEYLYDSEFNNNHVDGKGGAAYCVEAMITNSTFTNNSAVDGGAIGCSNQLTVYSSQFMYNVASNRGGAVYILTGSGSFWDSVFQNNKAGSNYISATEAWGNVPVVEITFKGNETWINAVQASMLSSFHNVTYWSGSMVNSDNWDPISFTNPGIDVIVEVYDSKGNLADNVTLVTDINNQVFYSSPKLDAGTYTLKAYHPDDYYYSYIETTSTFNVTKNSTSVKIKIEDNANFTYGNCNISFEVINRTEVRVVITNKTGAEVVNQTTEDDFIIVDLIPGDYNITVYNEANEFYSSSRDSKLFTILKFNSTIAIQPIEDKIYGNEFDVSITGDNLTSINVTVYGKDDVVVFTEILEEYIAHIPVLPVGNYTLVVVNLGNELINESRNSTTFNVLKAPNTANVTVKDVLEGVAVVINVTADVDGNYTLDINGTTWNVTVTKGKDNLTIVLPSGSYYVNVTFDNPNYDTKLTNATFRVLNTVIEAGDAKYGLNDKYVYQAKLVDEDGNPVANRTLNFTVDGKEFNATTNDQGIANITFNVAIGTYDMVISNNYTDNVTVKITVLPRIVENKNMVMDYDSDRFRVRALGDDGNPIAGETVKMTVNGVTYNVKTDKDGYAALPIELKPKTYTITSSYKGTTVKNTIKVKSTLKAKKTLKIKKTSRKLILKATLKWSNGKAIAGKKITIRFKGKTYTVKTNKKGIAKKVLTKKTIKKLKKGKTYKAKFSYKNETAFTKVKVKK